MQLKVIAHIHTDYKEKFGIPRQSGIAEESVGKIIFEKEYRRPEAFRGLEEFSHLWIIWQFSLAVRDAWSPTVRPPRLGGNRRMGVFATRSPYRPNPIGLSSVRLLSVENDEKYGTVLLVSGADLLDGTPIYDIKPYLAFTDSHEGAVGGFADTVRSHSLKVNVSDELLSQFDKGRADTLIKILSEDPRPAYKDDENYEYGMKFADKEVFFVVKGEELFVTRVV